MDLAGLWGDAYDREGQIEGTPSLSCWISRMDIILFLQALEPQEVFRLSFAVLSWCDDGPLYFLLFPLLYWGKAPSMAVRYG